MTLLKMTTKYLLTGLGLLLASSSILARENFFSRSFEQAGYGGPELVFTQLNGSSALIIGGRGAGIWGNDIYAFSTGLGAYMTAGRLALDATRDFGMAFGGVTVGYARDPSSVLHFNTDALLGIGQVWTTDRTTSNQLEAGNVLVLNLSVSADINLTEHFQLGIGTGWRVVSNPSVTGLSGSDLSGPSVSLSFEFGRFD